MKELNLGIKVEREHKPTYKFLKNYVKLHGKLPSQTMFYKKIAQNHISENKSYYKLLKRAKL